MGGRGGSKSSKSSNDVWKAQADMQAKMEAQRKAQQAQLKAQQQKMQAKIDAADRAKKEEDDRIAAQKAEAERQQAIQSENKKAADFRYSAESNIQKNFRSMAENQQRLDQQAAQNARQTPVGGSGYSMETAQQQKIAAAGGAGGVAGPASTNAPGAGQMGVAQAMALNAGTGGTKQSSNFSLPTATGLQFGGM